MAHLKDPASRAVLVWSWLVLAVALVVLVVVRFRTADLALERDEGEYAYAGQLLLQGIPPYKLAYNMKLPGTYAAYAGLMAVFGETPHGIRMGLLTISLATVTLLFFLGRKLFGTLGGIETATTFALLSISPAFLGMSAHANHFVVLFISAGCLLLLKAQSLDRRSTFFWSGVLFGLGFLMKQQGVFFILFGGVSIVLFASRQRPAVWKQLTATLSVFLMGSLLPFAATCLALWRLGVFPKFWFWTFRYAREYVSAIPTGRIWELFSDTFFSILAFTWGFWLLAGVGLGAALMIKASRSQGLWTVFLLLFSAAAVSVGFYFRPHYFILILPAVCLFVGASVSLTAKALPDKPFFKALPIAIFAAFVIHFIYLNNNAFFRFSPEQLGTVLYEGNPFQRMSAVATFIRQNSSPNDRIAVVGSEPELYFLAKRRSATGYIYTYGLMEPQAFALEMQKEMIREIEANSPEFIVMVNIQFSWLRRPDSNPLIFDWLTAYTTARYRPTGLLDFRNSNEVHEFWNPAGITNEPRADDFIVVFQRTSSLPK
jgi:4-amino-4-deoxy-L-arabinose transferase-like glycosyltransferase